MLAACSTPAEDARNYGGLDMAESIRGESKDTDLVLHSRFLVQTLHVRVAES
jgi:hypothetical protein